jgi:hypothetical protein
MGQVACCDSSSRKKDAPKFISYKDFRAMKITKDFNQVYVKKTMIGSGAFGKVFLGNRRDVGESHKLAIK